MAKSPYLLKCKPLKDCPEAEARSFKLEEGEGLPFFQAVKVALDDQCRTLEQRLGDAHAQVDMADLLETMAVAASKGKYAGVDFTQVAHLLGDTCFHTLSKDLVRFLVTVEQTVFSCKLFLVPEFLVAQAHMIRHPADSWIEVFERAWEQGNNEEDLMVGNERTAEINGTTTPLSDPRSGAVQPQASRPLDEGHTDERNALLRWVEEREAEGFEVGSMKVAEVNLAGPDMTRRKDLARYGSHLRRQFKAEGRWEPCRINHYSGYRLSPNWKASTGKRAQ